MRTADYLDAAKRAANLPSDYALAARLGVTRAAISSYRTGRTVPETLVAFRLADLLGVDPTRVVADIELEKAEKAHREEHASAWRSILGKLGGAAAAVTMAVGLVSAPSPAQAHTSSSMDGVCVMSNRRRRRSLLQAIDRLMHGMPAAAF